MSWSWRQFQWIGLKFHLHLYVAIAITENVILSDHTKQFLDATIQALENKSGSCSTICDIYIPAKKSE